MTSSAVKTLGIFGTSGFAREIDDVAHALGWRSIFVARDASDLAAWTADDEVIVESDASRYADMPFVIGIGNTALRQQVWQRFRADLTFINLIHPTASFGKRQREAIDARTGVVVAAGARFMNQIRVGDFSFFDLNVTIGHDTIIDEFVHIAPGANVSGNVHIGARCWIGAGAAINQGHDGRKLSIGADTVIGSGCVVIKDCEPASVYVGSPARKIK